MKKIYAFLLILLTSGCYNNNNIIEEMAGSHNEIRTNKNINILFLNELLCDTAQNHADWMAKNNKMVHEHGNSTPSRRVTESGYQWDEVGENIAYGYTSIDEVMKGWMNSKGHRDNILNKGYLEFGIGVAYGKDDTPYYCVVFAHPE